MTMGVCIRCARCDQTHLNVSKCGILGPFFKFYFLSRVQSLILQSLVTFQFIEFVV